MFANVIVERNIHKTLTYNIPHGLKLSPGQAVIVPLRNGKVIGYVIELVAFCALSPEKIKFIESIAADETLLSPDLIALALWMSTYYIAPYPQVIKCMLPIGVKQLTGFNFSEASETYLIPIPGISLEQGLTQLKQGTQQLLLFQRIIINQSVRFESQLSVTVNSLIKKGLIQKIKKVKIFQTQENHTSATLEITLTHEQQAAVAAILAAPNDPFLIHGVTGSGKTHVFIDLIRKKQCGTIVLVPEISLTPQMAQRFSEAFPGKVAVLHSNLKPMERKNMWKAIYRGEYTIVIGPRSAVFSPVKNLGLIIIDEEHDTSYKQESNPRYNAKSVALKRAKLLNAQLILASATPSLVTYFQTTSLFQLITLNSRVHNRPMPSIKLIDLTASSTRPAFLSAELIFQIHQRLLKNEQVMLFLNRRGMAQFMMCQTCNHVLKCTHCSVSLTVHAKQTLKCHYCGFTDSIPALCPQCKEKLRPVGKGTIKLEVELKKIFPIARILRLDRDSAPSFSQTSSILAEFSANKADILVGTQMIAKGHDFPNVTLVGIIHADASLHIPDYLAAERTFSLITQVAGRAGRATKLGEVLVQTYCPNHPVIQLALTQDYRKFYSTELEIRKQHAYPPYGRMIRIIMEHQQGEIVLKDISDFALALKPYTRNLRILGPAPAAIERIHALYRWNLLIKANLTDNLQPLKTFLLSCLSKRTYHSKITIDVDPQNLM